MVEVTWESALNFDFDANGEVNYGDIAALAAVSDSSMAYGTDYYSDDGYYFFTGTSSDSIRYMHNIDCSGKPNEGGQFQYTPVERYDAENTLPNTLYHAGNSALTDLATSFRQSINAYDVYFTNLQPGVRETSSLPQYVYYPNFGVHIEHPTLESLGMSEYDNYRVPSMKYSSFVDSIGLHDGLRTIANLSPRDTRIFKRILDLRNTATPTPYVCVRAIPINDDWKEFYQGEYPDDIYLQTTVSTTTVDKSITWNIPEIEWLNGDANLVLEIGGSPEWPEGLPHKFRVRWDEAEFVETCEDWTIKYALYITDEVGNVWDMIEPYSEVPVNRYYPQLPLNGRHGKVCFDLAAPGPGEYIVYACNSEQFDVQQHIGVKAYAAKPAFNDKLVARSYGIESDISSFTITNIPQGPDTEYPVFSGVKSYYPPIDDDQGFTTPYVPLLHNGGLEEVENIDPDARPMYKYFTMPLYIPHPDSSPGNPVYGPAKHLWLWTRLQPIYDVGYAGVEGIEDLEMRIEIYRTTMSAHRVGDYIADAKHPNGALDWLNDPVVDKELYAISLSYPVCDNGFPITEYPYLTEMFNSVYGIKPSDDAWRTPICPPFNQLTNDVLNQQMLKDKYEDILYKEGVWEYSYAVFDDWLYYTPNYVPTGSLPETDFIQDDNSIAFVYNEDLEKDNNDIPYCYVVFAAVNDEENHCTYDSVIDEDCPLKKYYCFIPGQLDPPQNAVQTHQVPYNIVDRQAFQYFNDQLEMMATGRRVQALSKGGTDSITEEQLYPEIAISDDASLVGSAYFSSTNGVVYQELEVSTNHTIQSTVDSATKGDVSIVYDSNNNPHFLYYRSSSLSTDYPVASDVTHDDASHSSSLGQNKAALSAEPAGIYYRARINGNWTERELVHANSLVAELEHQIYYNATNNQIFAVIPSHGYYFQVSGLTTEHDLGIPAVATRLSAENWQLLPVVTDRGFTNMYLSSTQPDSSSSGLKIAVYSPLGLDTSSNVSGIQIYSWNGSAVTNVLDVAEDVLGHQNIAVSSSGQVGIAYMNAPQKSLSFRVFNGSSLITEYNSTIPNSGYQPVVYCSPGSLSSDMFQLFSIQGNTGEVKKHLYSQTNPSVQCAGVFWPSSNVDDSTSLDQVTLSCVHNGSIYYILGVDRDSINSMIIGRQDS